MTEEIAFKVGDSVVDKPTLDNRLDWEDTRSGKVVDIISDTLVIEWANKMTTKRKANTIVLASEAQPMIDKLNTEFNTLLVVLREKMELAAATIEEAQTVATARGQNLRSIYEATRPLYNAMDNAGWRTSSLSPSCG